MDDDKNLAHTSQNDIDLSGQCLLLITRVELYNLFSIIYLTISSGTLLNLEIVTCETML